MYSMLNKNNETFRWFQYSNDILRVLVGRGVGQCHRDFESQKFLRTWKRKFNSFHELLCAVEASWVWIDGNEIESNTVITEFDTYLGPNNPGRKEPTCLSTEEDCGTVLQSNDKKKLVTAMSIMEEENGADGETRMVLYTGHNDSSLIKWSIDDNKQV